VKKLLGVSGALAVSAALLLAAPAHAATSVIHVPSDFVQGLSDTRTSGHYEVQGTGLRVSTLSNTSADKVAEYVATSTPLASANISLDVTNNSSGTIAPGGQLVVDFDNDGTPDGILVNETVYDDQLWLSNGSDADVKARAPHTGGGYGSPYHGTLAEWAAAFPQATVQAFGFSLGSSVQGDWTINSIAFAGTTYTFAKDVTLATKDECKNGGWATSTKPAFKNQGECVSSFATATNQGKAAPSGPTVVTPAKAQGPLVTRAL
jgi:hypothetical protein